MSSGVFAAFREHLASLDKKHFTSQELRDLFQSQPSGYAYHPHYFSKLLREKLGLYYYKPEPRDYRQSPEAEAQLQARMQATLDALVVMGKDVTQMAIGFADESAVQFQSNNARFWSLEPHLPRPINSELGSQKFFGFYGLVGHSILERMQGCKGEDLKPFLQAVRQANCDKKGVILCWDNATIHHQVEQWAWTQGIYIIYLPPYSPDLNPIERVWKSCKRWLNEQPYCKKKNELATLFEKAYDIYKVQLSFADGWLKKMQSIFSWICPIHETQNTPT